MAVTSSRFSPTELDEQRKGAQTFYPLAYVTLQIVFENFEVSPDTSTLVMHPSPKAITVHKNSYKEADSWQVTFDAVDFGPIPDSIRAGSCEIRLFQSDKAASAGKNITVLEELQRRGVEPTIVGLFDEAGLELSSDGQQVTLSGTDYTALFVGKRWEKDRRISTGKQLHETLLELMSEVESANNMRLVVEQKGVQYRLPEEKILPVDDNFDPDLVVREPVKTPVLGTHEARANRKRIKPVGETYWDVMYNLAVRHGYILFVRNLELVLATPNTYIEGKTQVKKLAWGENLTRLRLTRQMGRIRAPTIEVRSYDDVARKPIIRRFPTKPQLASTGIGKARDEIQVFTLPGIKEPSILEQAAKTRYNLLARHEQAAFIETRDLTDLEGTDLLSLSAGDAVTISFKPFSLQLLEAQPREQRTYTLQTLGFDKEAAEAVSFAMEKSQFFRKPLRVRESTLDWSVDSGLTISAELQNFIIIDVDERKA